VSGLFFLLASLNQLVTERVYFNKSDLVASGGTDKSAAAAKEVVRKAVYDDKFKQAPESLKNCVRVYYDAGFHVDVPVYRTFEKDGKEVYELASSDWKASDARLGTSPDRTVCCRPKPVTPN
jgi:hypothetical protein